jgi:hypothetical protein
MLTLKLFLEKAPKKFLQQLYQMQFRERGLVQGSIMLKKTSEWALDPERIRRAIDGLQAWQRQLLKIIYLSGNRGIKESEINLLFNNKSDPCEIHRQCKLLESNLLIYCLEGSSKSYHGFEDLFEPITEILFSDDGEASGTTGTWMGYRHFLSAHLMHFISRILLSQIRITQKGSLHRKSLQGLISQFQFGTSLSREVPEREIGLFFQFLAENNYLIVERGEVSLNQKGRKVTTGLYGNPILLLQQWWLERRMLGSRNVINLLGNHYGRAVGIQNLSRYLAIYSMNPDCAPPLVSKDMTWEQVPAVVQELWLQGFLEFFYNKGKIHLARFTDIPLPPGGEAISSATVSSQKKPVSLPNFESLLPPDTPSRQRLLVELLSEKLSDENMTRYRFSKESVIHGFQAGVNFEEFCNLLSQLRFDKNSRTTLTDWAMCYNASAFHDVLLLKLNDGDRFKELEAIPQFLALTRERIPGYGFLIPRQNKEAVKDFLARFGLYPADRREEVNGEILRMSPENQPIAGNKTETEGKIVYIRHESVEPHNNRLSCKYFKPARNQNITDKIRIVDFAIIGEKNLELSFLKTGRTRKLVKPLYLIKTENPVRLIANDIQTGHRNEYPLSEVTSLRTLE